MAKSKVSHSKSRASKRTETPVTPGIHRAAERAGIVAPPPPDETPLALKRGDVQEAAWAIKTALESVLDAESAGSDRDSYIMTALASLREAQAYLDGQLALSLAQSAVRS